MTDRDKIFQTRDCISPPDAASRAAAKARLDQLAIPHWALGRLMDLSLDLAGMAGSTRPPVSRKVVVTMAGDHGVVAEGVSAFPQEVTPQMVANFVAGGAGINALARQAGARVVVVDMGVAADISAFTAAGHVIDKKVARGTANMAKGAAMTMEQAYRAVAAGIEVAELLAPDFDLFGTGDMGIGNTTPSAAICAVLCGTDPEAATGRGTGVDDRGLARKVNAIKSAIAVNRPDPADALDTLAKVGGFEIGGIAGLILGAAARRKPVVVDGFISSAGALIAQGFAPEVTGYLVAAHNSMEQGHRLMLEKLGLSPLLNLGMRLGEGTGAALAMNLVEAAARILTDVATFEEARVSGAS